MIKIFNYGPLEEYRPFFLISQKEGENQPSRSTVDEENKEVQFPWYKYREKLGKYGEKVALAYLKTIYGIRIRDVSMYPKLGYDIELLAARNITKGFEIKTTTGGPSFFLTINELHRAMEMEHRYSIFLILIDKENEKVEGYLINNPIQKLNLPYEKMNGVYQETSKVTVSQSLFYISIVKNYLESFSYINLDEWKTGE